MCIMYRLIIALLGLTITLNGTQMWCVATPNKTSTDTTSTPTHTSTLTKSGTMVSNNTDDVSQTTTTPTKDVNETTSLTVSESTSMATSKLITAFTGNTSDITIPSTEYHNETTTPTVSESTSTITSIPAMATDTNTLLESTTLYKETGHKTTTLSVSEFTSRAADTTDASSGTATSRSSIILYLASGSAAVFVVMIVVGVIVIIRYKRRISRLKTSIEGTERNFNRKRRHSSTDFVGFENMGMHGIVNSAYDLQTVAHIPRITRGSVEYAVSVPPGNYSSVFTPYDKAVESNNDASAVETKPKGLFKSGFKLSNDEEDTYHPYFRLEPEIGEAANESSTDTTLRVANYNTDVAQSNTDLPMHVYNHIKLGQGNIECDGDSVVLCSDQYSHISISDDTASGKRQYYNIVSIQGARIESVDNYSHVGPNNTRINKHVHRDDYDHVAM